MTSMRRCVFGWALGVLLAGCGDAELPSLEQRLVAERLNAAPSKLAWPMTVMRPASQGYRHMGARSPFADDRRTDGSDHADGGVATSDTTAWREDGALEALQLVGTLQRAGTTWGLLRTPAGEVHLVGVGQQIGRGRVVALDPARIELQVEGVAPAGHEKAVGVSRAAKMTLMLDE